MHRLRFEIDRLRVEPIEAEFAIDAQAFDVADDPEFRFDHPIQGHLTARLAGGMAVYVTGTLRTRVSVDCARCLNGLAFDVQVPVRLTFLPEPTDGSGADTIEREDLLCYRGDAVEPMEALRDELLLALPATAHCDSLELPCVDPRARTARHTFGPAEDTDAPLPPNPWAAQLDRVRRQMEDGGTSNT
jgi:uncharacterized metal-binding protein YceD (DUF177 family)